MKNGTSVPLITSNAPVASSLVVLSPMDAEFLFACSALYTRTTRYWLERRWCPGIAFANCPGHSGNVVGPEMLILRPTCNGVGLLEPGFGTFSVATPPSALLNAGFSSTR